MFDRRLFNALARKSAATFVRSPPVFPMPAINGQPPILLLFDHADPGVEIAYEKTPSPDGPRVRLTTRETSLYWIPSLMPVFAVSEGRIVYARKHTDGQALIVEHRNGWATYYSRLERMFVRPTDDGSRRETRVNAGDILGYIGTSRHGPLAPLRFELWRCNRAKDYDPVDPIRYMHRWRLLRWNDARVKPIEVSARAA